MTLIDGDHIEVGARYDTEVCVVGAGPAGITLAHELSRHGVHTVLLESGGTGRSRRANRLSKGRSVGESYHRLAHARLRAFGGALNRHALPAHGWFARPLDPIDFERRAEVPHSGWPISRTHLDPFYERANVLCGLGPYDYTADSWQSPARGSALPLDPAAVQTSMFQLGLANFMHYEGELAASANVLVILAATVTDIVLDAASPRVSHLEVARDDGGRYRVVARHFVLAGGGIENARLLLASNRSRPAGIGNENDLVGRFFMERLTARSGVFELAGSSQLERLGLYEEQSVGDHHIQAILRVSDDAQRREGLQNCAFFLNPRSEAFASEGVRSLGVLAKGIRRQPLPPGLGRLMGNVVRDLPSVGRAAAQRVRRQRPPHGVLVLRVSGEQQPNPRSRVTLDRGRDHLGRPRARLEWRTTADDRMSIRRSQGIIGAELQRLGLGRLVRGFGDEQPPSLFEGAHHHVGTTRMAADNHHGVVDRDCRLHSVANLSIAGSSVFPTAGCSNPTLTIVALAIRLADRLVADIRRAAPVAATGNGPQPETSSPRTRPVSSGST